MGQAERQKYRELAELLGDHGKYVKASDLSHELPEILKRNDFARVQRIVRVTRSLAINAEYRELNEPSTFGELCDHIVKDRLGELLNLKKYQQFLEALHEWPKFSRYVDDCIEESVAVLLGRKDYKTLMERLEGLQESTSIREILPVTAKKVIDSAIAKKRYGVVREMLVESRAYPEIGPSIFDAVRNRIVKHANAEEYNWIVKFLEELKDEAVEASLPEAVRAAIISYKEKARERREKAQRKAQPASRRETESTILPRKIRIPSTESTVMPRRIRSVPQEDRSEAKSSMFALTPELVELFRVQARSAPDEATRLQCQKVLKEAGHTWEPE